MSPDFDWADSNPIWNETETTMTTTTDNKVPATTATAAKGEGKVTTIKSTSEPTPKAEKPENAGKVPSYVTMSFAPEVRTKLQDIATAEGTSVSAVVRKAVLQQLAGESASDDAKAGKVDAVSIKLDEVLAKLTRLDVALDSALSDTVRVADRLRKATAPQG